MLVAQLLPFVKNLSTRKWTDEDIVEDVQYLRDELTARFDSLTYVTSILPHHSVLTALQDVRRVQLRINLWSSLVDTRSRVGAVLEGERDEVER